MDKALELWKRLFEWTEQPFVYIDYGDTYRKCFFCDADDVGIGHEDDCIWIEAKKLVEEQT